MKDILFYLLALLAFVIVFDSSIREDNLNSKINELENKLIIYNKNKELFDQIIESKKHYPYLRCNVWVSVDNITWSLKDTINYKNK